MRSKRYFLVFLTAALAAMAIGAYLWSARESKPQLLSDGEPAGSRAENIRDEPNSNPDRTEAFVTEADSPATIETDRNTNPVTSEDFQRIQELVNEQWPDWIAEYGPAQARQIVSSPIDEGHPISVMLKFGSPKQISGYRWQNPSVNCRKNDHTDWICFPGKMEPSFHWPAQEKPIQVDSRLDDSLVFLSLEHVESYGLLAGRQVFSVEKASDRRIILMITPSAELGLSHVDTSIFVLAQPGASGSYTLRVLDDPPEYYRKMWAIE